MIKGNQVRAARGLLGWTIIDLAAKAGLEKGTVTSFENATRPATAETIEKIMHALQAAGIEFTPTGVQMASPIYSFDGPEWYVDLMHDVLKSGAKEVIVQNADNKKSSRAVLDVVKKIWANNVDFRFTIEEGDDYTVLPTSCYRWIPKKHFKNWVTVIYGERVAFSVNGNTSGKVIWDKDLADSLRRQFDLVWDILECVDVESTAHERIE